MFKRSDLATLIDEDTLAQRIRELGQEISRDYVGKDLAVIGILKGCFVFLADLARAIDIECTVDFLGLSSYGSATTSSGVVKITSDLTTPIAGRDVLVVEDIIDTGHTLNHVARLLQSRNPARLRTIALLNKPSRREVEFAADWVGFDIADEFVVGYGIDFAQRNRNLPFIGKVRFIE